jgi:hypothetical protein
MLTLSKTPGDLDYVDFILHPKHLDQVDFFPSPCLFSLEPGPFTIKENGQHRKHVGLQGNSHMMMAVDTHHLICPLPHCNHIRAISYLTCHYQHSVLTNSQGTVYFSFEKNGASVLQ